MRLTELHLQAFGRFRDQVVRLLPGLNVVYGANESGKSTLHSFAWGMLYGFAKPGLKSRRMLPEWELYHPWQGEEYRGALLLTADDGREYRVERDFARLQARVYDNHTGKLLTFPADPRGEVLFAEQLLGLNQVEFVTTVCIGQLQTGEIGETEATALSTRMAALGATGREDESAARASDRLAQWQKERVGTERARITTPLGGRLDQLEVARAEIRRVQAARAANLEREAQMRDLQQRLRDLEAAEAAVKAQIGEGEARATLVTLQRVVARLEVAREQNEAAERLRAELVPLAPLAQLDPAEAERVPAHFAAYQEAEVSRTQAAQVVQRRAQEVDRLAAELARFNLPGDPADLEARVDGLQAEVDRMRAQVAASGGTAGGSRTGWWVAAAAALVLALVLGAAVSAWAFLLAAVAVPLLRQALRAVPPAPGAEGVAQRHLAERSAELQALWQQCGMQSSGELKGRLRQAQTLRAQWDAARQGLEDLREQQEALPVMTGAAERLLGPLRMAAPCSSLLQRAVADNSVTQTEVDEFWRLWQSYRNLRQKQEEAERQGAEAWARGAEAAVELVAAGHDWAEPLRSACTGRDLAAARTAAAAAQAPLGDLPADEPELPTLAGLQRQRDELQTEVRETAGQVRELQGAANRTYEGLPDLAQLQRQEAGLEAMVEGLRQEGRALEKARQTIAEIAAEMHRQFAPRLVQRLSPVIADLTAGRYRELRISDQLELTTVAPETGDFRPVWDLSLGTIDQFYFALRLGAALELTAGGERPPILCDDSLVQCDDERALACLRYLADLAREYQVLLFTCHQRERDAARALAVNLIEL